MTAPRIAIRELTADEKRRLYQLEAPHPLYGWRFQGTDDAGESYIFDVHKGEHGWHVHHTYA